MGKESPAMQETWVRSLGREDPLEEDMATHSSILAWRIPWTKKPGRLQSMGSQRVGTTEVTEHTHRSVSFRLLQSLMTTQYIPIVLGKKQYWRRRNGGPGKRKMKPSV